MLVCILGDTHFGARGDNPYFHNHFKKFYTEFFFPYLKENNINTVIQLGDVFDRRKYVNFNTLQQSKEYFFDPLNEGFNSYLLVGNHDTYFRNTNDVNSLNLLLEGYSNITAILESQTINLDGVDIHLVPWINVGNETESIRAMEDTNAQIVCGHFEIDGFEMHRGAVHEGGLKPSVFEKFDMVLSGHFHTRSTRRNITYVGTPYEMTWSDWDDPKGFHILDTNTRELKFIPSPYQMFHKVWYDDLNKSLTDTVVADFSQYKETIVKVIIKNKTNPYWFDLYIEKLEKAGAIDIQVVEDHLNLNLEDDADIVNEAEDTLTILNKYVEQLELKADKQKLENLLRSLYTEALSLESL